MKKPQAGTEQQLCDKSKDCPGQSLTIPKSKDNPQTKENFCHCCQHQELSHFHIYFMPGFLSASE